MDGDVSTQFIHTLQHLPSRATGNTRRALTNHTPRSLSWQAGSASGPFLIGTLIQTMAKVSHPSYSAPAWQGVLMVFGVTAIVYILNVWGSRAMPLIQNIMLFVHIFAMVTFFVIFWVLSPRLSASAVFTEFSNTGGWSSMGLALMVGQISALYSLICEFPTLVFVCSLTIHC